jgi:hypothetical protein
MSEMAFPCRTRYHVPGFDELHETRARGTAAAMMRHGQQIDVTNPGMTSYQCLLCFAGDITGQQNPDTGMFNQQHAGAIVVSTPIVTCLQETEACLLPAPCRIVVAGAEAAGESGRLAAEMHGSG